MSYSANYIMYLDVGTHIQITSFSHDGYSAHFTSNCFYHSQIRSARYPLCWPQWDTSLSDVSKTYDDGNRTHDPWILSPKDEYNIHLANCSLKHVLSQNTKYNIFLNYSSILNNSLPWIIPGGTHYQLDYCSITCTWIIPCFISQRKQCHNFCIKDIAFPWKTP